MHHPRISVAITVATSQYGDTPVSVSTTRTVVEAGFAKPEPTSDELLELLPFLQQHVKGTLGEARSQLVALANQAADAEREKAAQASDSKPF